MIEALKSLGFDDFPEDKPSRKALKEWIFGLGIPPAKLAAALGQVRPPPEPRRRSRSPKGSGGSRGDGRQQQRGGGDADPLFDAIPARQMREVLDMAGIHGNSRWNRRKLMEELHNLGILPEDMTHLMGRDGPHRRQRRPPRGRGGGVFTHADEQPGPPGRKRRGKGSSRDKREQRRRAFLDEDDYESFYDDDVDIDDDEFDDAVGGFFYTHDDDYDDFYDFVMDDEPWGEEPPRKSRRRSDAFSGRGAGRGAGGPGFYSYGAYQQEYGTDFGASNGAGRAPHAEPPPWSAEAFRAAGFSFDPAFPTGPAETPEEAMTRALREGWAPQRLSRTQASKLLGVPAAASDSELRKAKRQSVLRWHPDRNPDNPSAGEAFQLVMAAADVLCR